MAKGKKDKKHKGGKDSADPTASVKLPKKLRKAGNIAMDLAREPVVSEIVAAALLSAATALRGTEKAAKAAGSAGDSAVGAAAEAGKQASKVGDALRMLAIDLARKTLDNWDRQPGGGKPGKPGKPERGGPDKPRGDG